MDKQGSPDKWHDVRLLHGVDGGVYVGKLVVAEDIKLLVHVSYLDKKLASAVPVCIMCI